MPELSKLPGQAIARLDVSDPGGLRLHKASSVALSMVIGIVAMAFLAKGLHQSIGLATTSGLLAMQTTGMVKDKTMRARQITTALVFAPAVLAVSIAATAGKHPLVDNVVFVLVVFAAVWVRRYGPRGTACGLIGFFAYFFALLNGVDLDGLPAMILAVGVGIGASLLVRTVLLRERPRQQMRRLRTALRAASMGVLDAARVDEGGAGERLHTRLDQLGETAMAIEDWQNTFETSLHLDASAPELAGLVFDAQISIEQTASALRALGPRTAGPGTAGPGASRSESSWSEELRQALAALQTTLRRSATPEQLADAVARTRAATRLTGAEGVAAVAIWHAATAQAALRRVDFLPWHVRAAKPATPPTRASEHSAAGAPESGHGDRRWWRDWRTWEPATRAAVQCSAAAAIATVLGHLISADRWYWAVLTSFMVFYGTTTTGEILSRAWRRVLGTVCGAVLALGVVFAVGHHPPVQLAMIVICGFLMFYLGPLSYAYLTFFITILLASLYELLGVLSLRVLEWRVEETLAGALVGIVCAYLIMSTRSSPRLVKQISGYLGRLDALIGECAEAVLAPGGDHQLVPAARALDAALAGVVDAASPLESVGTLRHRSDARRWRRSLQMNSRSAHVLARAGLMAQAAGPQSAPDAAAADAFASASAHVRRNVAVVAGEFDGTVGADAAVPALETEHFVMSILATAPHRADGFVEDGALPAAVEGLSRVNRTLPVFAR